PPVPGQRARVGRKGRHADRPRARNREGVHRSQPEVGMRRLVACVLQLALCACATEQWAKDGGEVADRKVLSECSQQSWARARYEQMAYPTAVPTPVVQNNKAEPVWGVPSPPAPFPQQDRQEKPFFTLCMKERGYALAPAAGGGP